MSSNRPETSRPPTSNTPSDSTTETSLPVITSKPYVPRASDLVVAVARVGDSNVPSTFLESEAVDASFPLGSGASFTVTRQSIPSGPKTMVDRIEFSKLVTLELPFRTPRRPEYIVYKSPKVKFGADGEPVSPEDRRALQTVLTELTALLHPPLRRHANIVTLLGVAWGSNHVDPLQRLPVLVVEYGDKGTLADVQLNGSILSDNTKLQISLGIASGLQALHIHGMVHGDLKPENIIMFSDAHTKLIPKLGDFGFAVIEAAEAPEITLGGTRMWRAPESYVRLPTSKLRFTDIYSFGLVVWSIALDGTRPSHVLVSENLKNDSLWLAWDQLTSNDKLLSLSQFEEWVPKWELLRESTHHPPDVNSAEPRQSADAIQLHQHDEALRASTCSSLRQRTFYKSLERVLASTLSLRPEQRDLAIAMDALKNATNIDIAE